MAQVGMSILAALMLYFGPMGPLLLSMMHFNSPFIQRILRDIDGKDEGDGLGGGDERYIDLPKFDLPEMTEAVDALTPPKGDEAPPTEPPPDAAETPDPVEAPPEATAPGTGAEAPAVAEKPSQKTSEKATKPGTGEKREWRGQGKPDGSRDGGGAPATGGKGKAAPCEADDPRVRRVGNVTEIERSAVEYYSSHLAEFNALGDAGTHRNVKGKVDGFRVGLGRCGFLYEAGFRNGDVVHAVNDLPIYTVVEAARAYLKLRGKSSFEVRITRHRELTTLRFRIVN